MLKRMYMFFLAVLILIMALFPVSGPVSAESFSVRKIISVVYDDSGSMLGDKWAYANYAMQTFCGMLNSEDELYLTYMSRSKQSSYTPDDVNLTASGIQKSIDIIRTHTDHATTPFVAVEKAFDKLLSVKNTDKNTQYWLVIITDGDFDECNYKPYDVKKKFIEDNLHRFTGQTMANGSYPQVTFMGIGNDVILPDEDTFNGIYTYPAESADEINDVMSKMADKISSRTRLQTGEMKLLNEKTIQVSSGIPLSNIAVLAQNTPAKVVSAKNGSKSISLTRSAQVYYPDYKDLNGGAYLLGEPGKSISNGTYDIVFDQAVALEDVVVLFEPALETRLFITAGGKEITDYRELENIPAGESVELSFKVYELGTDNEIPDDKLPAGTKFELSVSEEGQMVKETTGKTRTISGYQLKDLETELSSHVLIQGFNPIGQAVKLNPGKNVRYELVPGYAGTTKNVKYDKISENKNMILSFALSVDGKAITNPAVVQSFNPKISLSPQGNDGEMTIAKDGRILFTPNVSSPLTPDDDNLEVSVTCTLDRGVKATGTYTVVVADYAVIPTGNMPKIRKTEFFGNQKGVSFYVTKNGNPMPKSEVENRVSVVFDEAFKNFNANITIEDDGKVTVTPYSDTEKKLTFWNWWSNWYYYFNLPGRSMKITLMHTLASGSADLPVAEAPILYLVFCVALPLLIELAVLIFVLWCLYRYITIPRFASNAVLYIGTVERSRSQYTRGHYLNMGAIYLKQFNKFKYFCNPFKDLTVCIYGINFTAAKGGRLICHAAQPWFMGSVDPVSIHNNAINSPESVVNYCETNEYLLIREIPSTSVLYDPECTLMMDDMTYYLVDAYIEPVSFGRDRLEVIQNATIFCYSSN